MQVWMWMNQKHFFNVKYRQNCSQIRDFSLTKQVLHALCWLDDLCAHYGTAYAIKAVIGSGDNLEGGRKINFNKRSYTNGRTINVACI